MDFNTAICFFEPDSNDYKRLENVYVLNFKEFFYELYLSVYDGIIDDRRILTMASIALNDNEEELAALFNITPYKLNQFIEGKSDYEHEIRLKKLTSYLKLPFPVPHSIAIK